MIRFGMPLFDSAGHNKGILIFNYFGNELLQHFREAMSGGDPRNAKLLNRDGYWLSSNHSDDEWGFMLGNNERTFALAFAEEWRTISTHEQGMVQTERGLFVYATFYPLRADQRSSTVAVLTQAPSQQVLPQNEYKWKIVSFVPRDTLASGRFLHPDWRNIIASAGLCTVCAGRGGHCLYQFEPRSSDRGAA